jgi:hypothetical protein
MKTKYLVLGLIEQTFLTDAYLQQNGVKTESNNMVYGSHLGVYDTIDEATSEATKLNDSMYIGIEIKTIFVK